MEASDFNIVTVCAFCRHHEKKPLLEINFSDGKIYCMCNQCKKMNTLDLSKPLPPKYPKTRGL